MSLKIEFYSPHQKEQFRFEFHQMFKGLQYSVYQEGVQDIVLNWQKCRLLCKRCRMKSLFGRLHIWCCDMQSNDTNKSLFKEANEMVKESQ